MSRDPDPHGGAGAAIPAARGGSHGEGGAVLRELGSDGTPWLALALAGLDGHGYDGGAVTALDIADPQLPPIMVNPLEPEAGYPVQAHADRVAGLLEAAFGPPEPVAAAMRAGLRRSYADCGWDAVTGTVPPGIVTPPAVPSFRKFRHAVLAAARELGYSQSMMASVGGFMQAKLVPLWTGPAGRFLEGGHPADLGSLLRGNVLLTSRSVDDDEALSFLAGAVLLRVAERLSLADGAHPSRGPGQGRSLPRPGPGGPPDPHIAVVLAPAGYRPGHLAAAGRPGAAGWFSGLLAEIRSRGAEVVVAPGSRTAARRGVPGARPGRPDGQAPVPVLRGRRSAACGGQCRRRPCTGYELHAADALAHADGQAWLRLWVQTMLLAFLTGRPAPRTPAGLRSGWRELSPRARECALATLVDRAVTARAAALRPSYDPRRLMAVAAAVAGRMLDGAGPAGHGRTASSAPFRPGQVWVIPQLRWLHEAERLNPLGQDRIRPDDIAPPLEFGLAGLPDWPGIRVGERLAGLRRHPLSMESAPNRRQARIALLGEDGRAGLDADLAAVGMGLGAPLRLRYAARVLGVAGRDPEPGWLEVVLSWPDRMIRAARDPDLSRAATG
jgi:uncharacterized protein